MASRDEKKLLNIWAKTIKHAFKSSMILGQLPKNGKVKQDKNIALLFL
jgi:hypothetical protein